MVDHWWLFWLICDSKVDLTIFCRGFNFRNDVQKSWFVQDSDWLTTLDSREINNPMGLASAILMEDDWPITLEWTSPGYCNSSDSCTANWRDNT